MIKIIHTPSQNNSHSCLFLELSVNYFEKFRVKCNLLKIGYNEFSFTRKYQCILPQTISIFNQIKIMMV